MKIEEINKIVSDYNLLYELAVATFNKLKGYDGSMYYGDVKEINFWDNEVVIEYCYLSDIDSVRFPNFWLTLSDEELKEVVATAKNARLEKIAKEEEAKKQRIKQENEQRDLAEYERLKRKFEREV